MKEINKKLREIIANFAFERGVHISLRNFEEVELKDSFDLTDLYDLETLIEDEFFDGEDLIPDNQYTKIKDIINFIKIELALREETEETVEEKIETTKEEK